ncbi:hypothetical protein SAMN05421810_11559 [Amycolatopsis arida]|uniref:Cobyrinic acid a,c-diamide synthase n=1 Tax=Amycolatopsis arida TaxID=587909 RepID=A0A1I6AXA0_9PSEU|nr:cobyrinic acid a,c-diamide synthase [Amycolatopsis arida]TDX85359.1 hypothetical protein CLV69_11518 [Amycolatopsis arida]SFQ73296.1 hypothetical protein SAMN05421810_11559 [Amycolatopsis arida]
MSRRASLPGASELFRRTSSPALDQPDRSAGNGTGSHGNGDGSGDRRLSRVGAAPRRGSGRQKHDAKITVYVSSEELVAMEQARLALRASHELAVDRGRLVREAVAVLLADFEEHGEDSILVQRLRADVDEPGGVEEATG